MDQTVEYAIETLVRNRNIGINVRATDKKKILHLFACIPRGFTRSEVDLALKLISQYQYGLSDFKVDVNNILKNVPTRRTIRSMIEITAKIVDKEIHMTHNSARSGYQFTWGAIRSQPFFLNISTGSDDAVCRFFLNELSVVYVVELIEAAPKNTWEISPELLELYYTIKSTDVSDSLPIITKGPDGFYIKNGHPTAVAWFEQNVVDKFDVAEVTTAARRMSIKMDTATLPSVNSDSLTSIVINSPASIFNINTRESKFGLYDIVNSICATNQFPVLVIVGENNETANLVKTVANQFLENGVPASKMNVFFRLTDVHNSAEFNKYVKDSGLNSHIDNTTKVVFITGSRLPKPLVESSFKHTTSMVLVPHDFGKVYSYASRGQITYGYRDSIVNTSTILRKTKGLLVENL